MTHFKRYIDIHIAGIHVAFYRGNIAWELNLGRFWLQVFYRPFRKKWGIVRVGRF